MEHKTTAGDLRKLKIMAATPMYGGQCYGSYTNSLLDLQQVCSSKGVGFQYDALFNESLIPRARNILADNFLRSDCTHLVFLDADVGFKGLDVLRMIVLDKDIIGAPYPKKTISWEKVLRAAQDENIRPIIEKNPTLLEQFAADFVFSPDGTKADKDGMINIKLDEPLQVTETGTGFMAIKREALERYMEAYPELSYKPDHSRTKHFSGDREVFAFFDTAIDEKKRYLSEDYLFCKLAREAGLEVWLCPYMHLDHTGTITFRGSIKAMAALKNVNLTGIDKHNIDKETLDNMKSSKGI